MPVSRQAGGRRDEPACIVISPAVQWGVGQPPESNMGDKQHEPPHSVKKEPKFCRCRVCHEHFYGDTVAEAAEACREHGRERHPEWEVTACFCPD